MYYNFTHTHTHTHTPLKIIIRVNSSIVIYSLNHVVVQTYQSVVGVGSQTNICTK